MIVHADSSWSGNRVPWRGEHREQEKQSRFRPELAADATDGVGRWSKSRILFQRIAPANHRRRRGNREQADDEKGRDIRPEEYVDHLIGSAFGRGGGPDEPNEDNHGGKKVIDTADSEDFVALHGQAHGADLEGENAAGQRSSLSSVLASLRSGVSKPSVNQS
jgi:hypothetical protein